VKKAAKKAPAKKAPAKKEAAKKAIVDQLSNGEITAKEATEAIKAL
jgi:hypothetical protein